MAGYGFHRDIPNSELDIEVAGTVIFTSSATAVTIPAGATSGLTVAAGGVTVTAGGVTVTAGALGSVSDTIPIGYATGAGGTVAQQTDKGTTVVMSKPCGKITMDNAQLNAGVEVIFTVTNTLVSVTDVIVVVHTSAGTAGGYLPYVSRVANGAFDITVSNISGGNLTEAPVLNFAVISAVVA